MAGPVHPRDLGKDRHTSNGQDIFEQAGQAAIIDSRITQKENANLKAYQGLQLGQLSLDEPSSPNRPSYGDKGVPITLWTNYMEMSMTSNQVLFTYSIVIDERLGSRRKRQHFMETALRQLQGLKALGSGVATDYAGLIVTCAKVDLGSSDHSTFTLEFYDTEFPEGRVTAPSGSPFKLQMSLVGTLSSSDLGKFMGLDLTGSAHSGMVINEAVHALNIIMAAHPNNTPDVYQSGQNKFFRYPSPESFSSYNLGGGLIAVRGYFSSVRFSTSRMLLNLNSRCTPFYRTMNVRELVHEFQKSAPGNWPALEEYLRNLRVKTSYMTAPGGKSVSKVRSVIGFSHKRPLAGVGNKRLGNADFDHGNANEITFKLKGQSEKMVSVKQYFLAQYGLTLKHPEAIVLNCGTKDTPVWIPAELCTVMAGQAYHGVLDGDQTTRMLKIAARPPAENASRIVAADGGLGQIGVLPSRRENLAAFGLTVKANMIAVPGRVLPPPRVMYSGNSMAKPIGGSWNMRDKKLSKPATLMNWTILRIGAAADVEWTVFEKHCKALTAIFASCGLKVNAPVLPGPSISVSNKIETDKIVLDKVAMDSRLQAIFNQCKARKISTLLVVLPSTDSWLYGRLKFWGDQKCGVHTICVQLSQIRKEDPNFSANVALKVNLKLGGVNQCLSSNDLGFLGNGNTMVVGIDVTHPAPGAMRGCPSIAGVVASSGPDLSQWPGDICCQESKKEMVTNLDRMMEERIRYWMAKNPGKKLQNIIVYRDGVSEGQYMIVQQDEIPAVRKACEEVFKDAAPPKITFLIVGKNHNTRFYPTIKKQADQRHNCNIPNGTVVDRGITMPKGWDFFMAAHTALQGTTKPAHYVVLLDEIRDTNKLDANQLEKITHNLSYLYGRATKAVSVCPPAYYAHLICLRARCYLADYISRHAGEEFDWNEAPWRSGVYESLKDSMFYI